MSKEPVTVRVRDARALSLAGENGSSLHKPGDELELPAEEAEQLAKQGYVEPA